MEEKKTRTKEDWDKLRDQAEDCIIRLGMSGRATAELLDISEQTISKWRTDGKWDERKEMAELTPVKLKETLMLEATNIANGEKSKIDADALSKVMKAIDRLDKTVNPRVVASVLKTLDNFIVDHDPEFAIEATKYHKLFLQHIISLE